MLRAMRLTKAGSGQWLLTIFLLAPLAAFPQTRLTGAIQFLTNSAGATAGGQIWNTLAGDSYFCGWPTIRMQVRRSMGRPTAKPASTYPWQWAPLIPSTYSARLAVATNRSTA